MDELARGRRHIGKSSAPHLGRGSRGIAQVARSAVPLPRLLADVLEGVVEVVIGCPDRATGQPRDPAEDTAGPEHAMDLAQRPEAIRNELEDEGRDRAVDAAIAQREVVSEGHAQLEAGALLARQESISLARRLLDHPSRGVDRGDAHARPSPEQLDRERSGAGPDVEEMRRAGVDGGGDLVNGEES